MGGIFAPLDITSRAVGPSAWFSALPRTPNGSSRNTLGFTLGLQQEQVSSGLISSSERLLCRVARPGCSPGSGCWTTEAGSSSAPVSPSRRVAAVRAGWSIAGSGTLYHSTSGERVIQASYYTLQHRVDSWVLVSVLVILGDLAPSQYEVALLDQLTRVLTPDDFQDAEDPVTQMMLVTDQGTALLRDDRYFQGRQDL